MSPAQILSAVRMTQGGLKYSTGYTLFVLQVTIAVVEDWEFEQG